LLLKPSDWGKLFARLFAVICMIFAATIFTTLLLLPAGGHQSETSRWIVIITGLGYLVASALLWFFADRFAPSTEPSGDADHTEFGVLVLCSIAAYYFYHHLELAVLSIFDPNLTQPKVSWGIVGGIAWQFLLCVGFFLAIVYSRRLVRWMLR
jgi:peptidoglycan biosynthesis protein MviN/MurJ (putative lipid II flippase)